MKKDIRPFIIDILDSIEKIEKYLEKLDKNKFFESTQIQDAVVRRLEIIGEATKNIPDEFKSKHNHIPWNEVAKTRNKLIHGYFGINLERVWNIVKDDLPGLKKKIKSLLTELEKQS